MPLATFEFDDLIPTRDEFLVAEPQSTSENDWSVKNKPFGEWPFYARNPGKACR